MRRVPFTEGALGQIRHDRYRHPHPHAQRKMEVLWLKSQGLAHKEIASLADVSPRSVQRYLGESLVGGLDLIRRIPWRGKPRGLEAHRASLGCHFIENPPRSAREAQQEIERLTGVRRGLSQVRAFPKETST